MESLIQMGGVPF